MKKIGKKFLLVLCVSVFTFFSLTNYGLCNSLSRYHQSLFSEYSQRISMDFKDADLRSVLKIFSQQSGLNFIAATDVANMTITLYLDDVPVEEALERILYANGLMYEIEPGSDIFIVKKVEKPAQNLITRVYPLKHATVSSSKLLTLFEDGDEGSSSSSSGGEDEESKEGILFAIESILTVSGKVIEDSRTNSLIVTDIPSQFPLIERTIASLDVPIVQVLIEVEMLDISKNTAEQLGIKFGDTLLSFSGAKREHVYPWDQNALLDKGYEFDTEYTSGTIDASGLTMILQFLKTISDTKSLAAPKILTLNNHTAELKLSTDEAIGVTTSTTSSEGIATASVEAERALTGVFLNVTPQINPQTGEIIMSVYPRVIEARTGETFASTTFRDPEERGTKSILKTSDGETIYIGGLKRIEAVKTITKIPILGDIPFIGSAFRHKGASEEERELVIFITPRIIRDANSIPSTAANTFMREQNYPERKLQEIERALLITEQRRRTK
ncbi:MAG: secretin N-terminal domain-containing protein [Candidatus Aceula meridiana]|nr:secretin N-terminal domain-containing protein [Candidatus Aceula meridiana]